MANHFLHLTGVPLRSTPADEKCVRRQDPLQEINLWLPLLRALVAT